MFSKNCKKSFQVKCSDAHIYHSRIKNLGTTCASQQDFGKQGGEKERGKREKWKRKGEEMNQRKGRGKGKEKKEEGIRKENILNQSNADF